MALDKQQYVALIEGKISIEEAIENLGHAYKKLVEHPAIVWKFVGKHEEEGKDIYALMDIALARMKQTAKSIDEEVAREKEEQKKLPPAEDVSW